MSFYKNVGGFVEYTNENILNTYIPLNTVIVYKDLRKDSEVILKCLEKERGLPCKDCFFRNDLRMHCPICMPYERIDRKNVTFMIQ